MSVLNKVLVLTLGFDEKFAIRSLMRHSNDLSKTIIIMAEPVEERAQRALVTVKDFIERFIGSIEYEVITVDPSTPYDTISRLKKKLRENLALSYVISVSGGMRAMIVELVVAASLAKIPGELEIELENFKGIIKLPLKLLYMQPLSSEEYKVLKALIDMKIATAKDLLDSLHMPRSSFYRYLKELVTKDLIKEIRKGKTAFYEPTELAKVII